MTEPYKIMYTLSTIILLIGEAFPYQVLLQVIPIRLADIRSVQSSVPILTNYIHV